MATQTQETIPLANRPATFLSSAIIAQTLATAFVALRLFARHRLVHGLGLDDLFVTLSCCTALIGTVFACLELKYGLGKHMRTLQLEEIVSLFYYLFWNNCIYAVSTTLIKISILLQYIRVAPPDRVIFRRVCVTLIGIISMWGLAFFIMNVFACRPIAGMWQFSIEAHCVLSGSRDLKTRVAAVSSQAASNMAFDIIIYCMPLVLVRSLKLSQRSLLGLAGVFALGASVIMASIFRLENIITKKFGLVHFDPTWALPPMVIWTVLEANLAVICASIPVFWPVIAQIAFGGTIVVVSEIIVESEARPISPQKTDSIDAGDLRAAWDEERLMHQRMSIKDLRFST